jgi:hypothetical protein
MLPDPLREAFLRAEARTAQSDNDEGTLWLPIAIASALLAGALFAIIGGN